MAYTPLEKGIRDSLAAMLQDAPDPIEVLDRAEAEIMAMLGNSPDDQQAEILRAVREAIADARSSRR